MDDFPAFGLPITATATGASGLVKPSLESSFSTIFSGTS